MELEIFELNRIDFENTRDAVSACLTYCTAQDIAASQLRMSHTRTSELTRELERVKERLDGILGDWLLAKHLDEEGRSDSGDEVEQPEEEPLPEDPLGTFQKNRRARRRLEPEEQIEYEEPDDSDD